MNQLLPAFIANDGEVFEIPDLPEDLGRACALASEATLRKFWDTPQEDEAWRDWLMEDSPDGHKYA